MLSTALIFILGVAVGVVFHATIKPWAIASWQRFRTWRKNATRN